MVNRESGISTPIVLVAVFVTLFVGSSAFGFWAFTERQDYKNNVEKKVADASTLAVQKAETAKEADFVEREKAPYQSYVGPATYGSLSFSFPKTWSVYQVDKDSGTVLDVYANPRVVPGVASNQLYAFRVEIVSNTYDQEVKKFSSSIASGKLTAQAFRLTALPDTLGLRVEGEISSKTQGIMILLPLRDKTIKLFTESQDSFSDFNDIIIPSLTFIP